MSRTILIILNFVVNFLNKDLLLVCFLSCEPPHGLLGTTPRLKTGAYNFNGNGTTEDLRPRFGDLMFLHIGVNFH